MEIITITCSMRPNFWPRVADNICNQTRKPNVSLLMYHKTLENPSAEFEKRFADAEIPLAVARGRDEWNLSSMFYEAFQIVSKFARGMNTNNGLFVIMDDDDDYGPGYLAQLEDVFLHRHQDAAILGKSDFWVRFADMKMKKRYVLDSSTDWPVASVAGSSIAVSIPFWFSHPNFRHNPKSEWADQSILTACHNAKGLIYNTGPEHYMVNRFGIQHGHGWLMPLPPIEECIHE